MPCRTDLAGGNPSRHDHALRGTSAKLPLPGSDAEGEIVNGTLSAANAREVAARIEYLRLLPIETVEEKAAQRVRPGSGCSIGRARRR